MKWNVGDYGYINMFISGVKLSWLRLPGTTLTVYVKLVIEQVDEAHLKYSEYTDVFIAIEDRVILYIFFS